MKHQRQKDYSNQKVKESKVKQTETIRFSKPVAHA